MSHGTTEEKKPALYGYLVEFDSPERMVAAAEKIRDAGYRQTDAFTPFPVHGIIDALGLRRTRLTRAILLGGTVGACTGLALQWWVSAGTNPWIVSGKPLFSWPNFIPVIFECMVLFSAFTAVITMLVRNGLPRPYHPVFSAPRIELASSDKFFILVQSADALFDVEKTRAFLRQLVADRIIEVPWAEET
jgi:hypothetical protein